jgi:uncharacterized protein YaiI (UPF0178 family)
VKLMKIWVDADAAPRATREILVRAAVRREVNVVLVANGWLQKPDVARVEVVLVAPGADVADDHIAENIEAGELCITADIPLAARVVEKGARVITPYGKELTAEEVGEALSIREFHAELRDAGVQTGGPPPYNDGAKQKFANAVDRWITKNS